jgi:Uma2 family endonuclease
MATTAISIDEYLRTVPDPDVEYVDGELRERPMTFNEHGLLQTEIGMWFNSHRHEWNVRAGVEGRTRVSPTRVRLPDVIVDHARKWPSVLIHPANDRD